MRADKEEPRADVWAVFNLETVPDNFKFVTALGPVGSTSTGVDLRALRDEHCSVFIHQEPGWPQPVSTLTERKLEFVPFVDGSVIDDPAIANRCREQLSLAFRLFNPQPFWMLPWLRRHEMSRFDEVVDRYALSGEELTAFCKFAEHLVRFHSDRNLYRVFRRQPFAINLGELLKLPVDEADDERRIQEAEVQHDRFLSRVAHLMIATEMFEHASDDPSLSTDLRLILLVIAAEALVVMFDKPKKTEQLARRLAIVGDSEAADKEPADAFFPRLCKLRGWLVHGAIYDRGRWMRAGDVARGSSDFPGSEAVLNYGFPEVKATDLCRLTNLVRWSLLYCMYFAGYSEPGQPGNPEGLDKDGLSKRLEAVASVPDGGKVLRREISQAWGLGEAL